MKKLEVVLMDYGELEDLVREHTGLKEFVPVADFEWGNDSFYLFQDVKRDPNATGLNRVEESIAKDRILFSPLGVMNWLCMHAHIEPGNYLVSVSW